MERISEAQASRQFSDVLNRVFDQGITIEVEREDKSIARITPVPPESALRVEDLNDFFARLPSLGDDAEAFALDLEKIRSEVPFLPTS